MSKIASTDEWRDAVVKHINKLPENEKFEFAHTMIFEIALWVGCSSYETIGLMECAKM
jgi:hypothetical protein